MIVQKPAIHKSNNAIEVKHKRKLKIVVFNQDSTVFGFWKLLQGCLYTNRSCRTVVKRIVTITMYRIQSQIKLKQGKIHGEKWSLKCPWIILWFCHQNFVATLSHTIAMALNNIWSSVIYNTSYHVQIHSTLLLYIMQKYAHRYFRSFEIKDRFSLSHDSHSDTCFVREETVETWFASQ